MIGNFRSALVTGASSGIGRAVATRLRAEGVAVHAIGRDAAALEALAAEQGIVPLALDVRDTARLAEVFHDNAFDVLVNNAGLLTTRAAFQDMKAEHIDTMIDVNLKAPLHLARLALPGMVARRRGHLFFIGSTAGHTPYPNMTVYGASKAGIALFCDALRCDLVGTGVRVSEISPGRVETRLYRTALGDRAQAELYDGYLSIRPEDIAELIVTALKLPEQVDVSRMEVFPTAQAAGGGRFAKASEP